MLRWIRHQEAASWLQEKHQVSAYRGKMNRMWLTGWQLVSMSLTLKGISFKDRKMCVSGSVISIHRPHYISLDHLLKWIWDTSHILQNVLILEYTIQWFRVCSELYNAHKLHPPLPKHPLALLTAPHTTSFSTLSYFSPKQSNLSLKICQFKTPNINMNI